MRTERIRLTSAVTVLSATDPVRVFQQFAMIDLLSRGRAEMIVGRGSFIEAFPLLGLNLSDYDSLFASKLELLLKIRETHMFIGVVRTARLLLGRPFSQGRINNVFPSGWVWEAHLPLLCAQELSDFR